MKKNILIFGVCCMAFYIGAGSLLEGCADSPKSDKSAYLSDNSDSEEDCYSSNDLETSDVGNDYNSKSRRNTKKVYKDYESACYDEDFDAAHKILSKQKLELKNAIKEAQRFRKENELVKKVGEKIRLFKKNKNIYDTSNRDTYEGMIEECKGMAEEYLNGIIYVFDEEIRVVDVNFDEALKLKKIEMLKGQRITELKFFKNLYLEDTWSRNCFEDIIEKVNELIEEYK